MIQLIMYEMNFFGWSSTGLPNIDENEFTSDNSTLFSLNVSGNTDLNNVIVYGNATLFSSLNVGGFTTLVNALNVNNFTILSNSTTINESLFISGVNDLEIINIHGAGLSTLINFRSDDPDAVVTKKNTTFFHLNNAWYLSR